MGADGGFCLFAAVSLRERLHALTKEARGVRQARAGGDMEHVHRMRVASRRLRSALRLFEDCLPKKRARAWRRGMREITRALGAARDLDVQMAFLGEYLAGLDSPRLRRGPERLLLRLSQSREKAQEAVLAALDAFDSSGMAGEMAGELPVGAMPEKVDPSLFRTPALYRRALRELTALVEALLKFEPFVDRPEEKEALHAMRIANKRLRYAMEIFGPLYDDGLAGELAVIREFHSLLGDIHDCDVWEEFLPSFLEEERRRTREFFGHDRFFSRIERGIEALAENRRLYRNGRYGLFRELFHRRRDEGFWQKLADRLGEFPGSR